MEEYLSNMKNLRSQMNDFEEEAANLSVEEQKQITAIQTLEKDLDTVKSETRHFKEEMDAMVNAKCQICCQIIEKQKKLSSLETESSTLSQTLELLEQERVSVEGKLKEKSTYYNQVKKDLIPKLQEQEEWFNSMKPNILADIRSVEEFPDNQMDYIEGTPSKKILSIQVNVEDMMQNSSPSNDKINERYKNLMGQLEAAKTNLEGITVKKSGVALKMDKSKQLIEKLKNRMDGFPPEMMAMDTKTLEEEHQALLADKAGEMEYLQSLQDRIEQLQRISEEVTCQCRKVYKVNLRD